MSDHVCRRSVCKFRFRHICYQTCTDVTLETTETSYIPIASIDQTDLEFLVPADHDTYIDLDIQLYIRDQLIKADGAELKNTDHTAVTNNFLHSLFSQCGVSLKGVITPASDLYQCRVYVETTHLRLRCSRFISRICTGIWIMATCCPAIPQILIRTRQGLHEMERNKTEQRDRIGGTIT
jgi:hypothetical protein